MVGIVFEADGNCIFFAVGNGAVDTVARFDRFTVFGDDDAFGLIASVGVRGRFYRKELACGDGVGSDLCAVGKDLCGTAVADSQRDRRTGVSRIVGGDRHIGVGGERFAERHAVDLTCEAFYIGSGHGVLGVGVQIDIAADRLVIQIQRAVSGTVDGK